MPFENLQLANSRFIDTYVGIPLDQIERSGNILQDRYYQNVANQNQIELALEQQPYLQGDEAVRDSLRGDLKKAITGIAETGGDYENATQRVSTLSKAFLTDPRRLQAEKNYKSVQEEVNLEEQMRAKGLTPLRTNRRENFSTVDPSTGELNDFQSDLQQQLDYDKVRENLFDDLKADAGPLSVKSLTQDERRELVGYIKTGQWAGVSKGKVKNYLDEAFNRYRSTPEYQQQKYFGASDDQIVSQLMSTGLERVFGQSKDDLIRDLSMEQSGKGIGQAPYAWTSDGAIALENKFPDPDDFEVRSRTSPGRMTVPNIGGEGEVEIHDFSGALDITVGRAPELKPEEVEIFNTIADAKVGKDASEEERFKAYQDYVNTHKHKNTSPKIRMGDYLREGEAGRSTRADASLDANATFPQRTFYDIEQGEIIQGNNPDFFEDHLDGKENQLQVTGFYDAENNFTHITGNEAFAVGMAVRIKGTNKQYIMSRLDSDRQNPQVKFYTDINRLYNKASITPELWVPVQTITGTDIEVKQSTDKDGNPIGYSLRVPNSKNVAKGNSLQEAIVNFRSLLSK